MELELWRYSGGADATLGLLMVQHETTRELLCFTCEDEFRTVKVDGETRIPAGRYKIEFRESGGMHARYNVAFPKMHKGMLWLRDVPGFTWAYIHIGNDDDDTLGCILVAEDRNESTRSIQRSRHAYERIYPDIAAAIESGEGAWITIYDLDRPRFPAPSAVL